MVRSIANPTKHLHHGGHTYKMHDQCCLNPTKCAKPTSGMTESDLRALLYKLGMEGDTRAFEFNRIQYFRLSRLSYGWLDSAWLDST